MTKEKARERIKVYNALDNLKDFDLYSPYQKDLSIVIDYIEELEKEIEDLKEAKQCLCEDAISRAEILKKQYPKASSLKYLKPTYIVDVDDIESLPSVQPQPKTGYWIDTGSGQKCSECREIQYGYDNFRHFCSNCGTDMRGDDKK